jgi:hypothetical protein
MGATQRAGLTMPKKLAPRIASVAADKPLTLNIYCDRGGQTGVDVSGLIETFRLFEPLRHSPDLF